MVISILLKSTFRQISIYSQSLVKFYSDQTRIKSLLKRLKNIGMASEKLYRNTLTSGSNAGPVSKQSFNETPFSVFADASKRPVLYSFRIG